MLLYCHFLLYFEGFVLARSRFQRRTREKCPYARLMEKENISFASSAIQRRRVVGVKGADPEKVAAARGRWSHRGSGWKWGRRDREQSPPDDICERWSKKHRVVVGLMLYKTPYENGICRLGEGRVRCQRTHFLQANSIFLPLPKRKKPQDAFPSFGKYKDGRGMHSGPFLMRKERWAMSTLGLHFRLLVTNLFVSPSPSIDERQLLDITRM